MSEIMPPTSTGLTHVCPACKRRFVLPAAPVLPSCPICQNAQLQASAEPFPMPDIELVLPPAITPQQLHATLAKFRKEAAYPFPDFTTENLIQRIMLIYWPYWLADAKLTGVWDATFGYDYQVKSSRESMGGGGWRSRDVIKTKVRGEARKGFIERKYDNVIAPALSTHDMRLKQIGDYEIKASQAYRPELLSGAISQAIELHNNDVETYTKQKLVDRAKEDCRVAADAYSSKSYKFNGQFQEMHWTQGLLPMFTTYYEDGKGQKHMIAVNGQSGQVYGGRMASYKKALIISGLMLAIAVLVAVILAFFDKYMAICSASLFMVAFTPILRALVWNGDEKRKPPLA